MKIKLLAAALVMGLVSFQTPVANAAFPIIALPLPTTVNFDAKTITLVPPTSNSPGAWTLDIADKTIATNVGMVVTILKTGSTRVTFTQAPSGAFIGASRSTQLNVKAGTPTIGTFAPITGTLLQGSATILPPTSSGTGSWNYTSSDQKIATIAGNVIRFLDIGTATITASQGSDGNWVSASASTTVTVSGLPKTLGSFSDISIAKDSVATLNLVKPTSNSPGNWTFTISDPSIALLSGLVLTPLNIGTAKITAYQAPAAGFGSSKLTMTLTISGAAATLGDFKDVTYNQSSTSPNTLTITAPTSSSPATWTFTSADPAIATITTVGNLGNVRVLKPGHTKITASQNPSGNFSATSASMVLTVTGAPSYVAPEDLQKVVGDPEQVVLPPTSVSAGAWVYTSSSPDVVSISGQKLIFGNAGSATITMSQAANDYWLAGSTSFKVNVQGTTPTIGSLAAVKVEVGQTLATIPNPTSNSTGKWKYTITDPAIAKVVDNKIVGISIGATTIIATQLPGGKYGQSNSVQAAITVVAATTKPTPKPSASATPKPTATSVANKPVVKVTVKKRVINISVKGSIVTVLINGKKKKLGANKVSAGANTVVVKVGSTVIFNKTYKIL